MREEKQYYALGMAVNDRLVFLSGVDADGESPNIKFTDDESEMMLESNLVKLERAKDLLSTKGVEVEIIKVTFEDEV